MSKRLQDFVFNLDAGILGYLSLKEKKQWKLMHLILDHHSLLYTLPAMSTIGTLYCYCKQPEDGSEMITCDNPVCDIELPHHLFKNHCYS